MLLASRRSSKNYGLQRNMPFFGARGYLKKKNSFQFFFSRFFFVCECVKLLVFHEEKVK